MLFIDLLNCSCNQLALTILRYRHALDQARQAVVLWIVCTGGLSWAFSAYEWHSLTVSFNMALVFFNCLVSLSVSTTKDTRRSFEHTISHVRYVVYVFVEFAAIGAFKVLRVIPSCNLLWRFSLLKFLAAFAFWHGTHAILFLHGFGTRSTVILLAVFFHYRVTRDSLANTTQDGLVLYWWLASWRGDWSEVFRVNMLAHVVLDALERLWLQFEFVGRAAFYHTKIYT